MAYDPHLNRTYSGFNANDILRWVTAEINETIELTEEILDEAAEYAVGRLEALSPKSRPRSKQRETLKRYAESWKIRKAKPQGYRVPVGTKFNVAHATARVVYNTQGKLTHILEYGTVRRETKIFKFNRGRIDDSGLRHIENAYQDTLQFINQILQ